MLILENVKVQNAGGGGSGVNKENTRGVNFI